MFEDEARVLIVLPRDLVDRARGLAGRVTTSMKLPVSLQIVFRALLEEGLRRPGDADLLANIGRQAQTVRRIRSEARHLSRRRIEPATRTARTRAATGTRRRSS